MRRCRPSCNRCLGRRIPSRIPRPRCIRRHRASCHKSRPHRIDRRRSQRLACSSRSRRIRCRHRGCKFAPAVPRSDPLGCTQRLRWKRLACSLRVHTRGRLGTAGRRLSHRRHRRARRIRCRRRCTCCADRVHRQERSRTGQAIPARRSFGTHLGKRSRTARLRRTWRATSIRRVANRDRDLRLARHGQDALGASHPDTGAVEGAAAKCEAVEEAGADLGAETDVSRRAVVVSIDRSRKRDRARASRGKAAEPGTGRVAVGPVAALLRAPLADAHLAHGVAGRARLGLRLTSGDPGSFARQRFQRHA
jgi:hypothetical protein